LHILHDTLHDAKNKGATWTDGGGSSGADVAHYMLHALQQPETIKQTIGIAN
jgi:hypothetical protein